MTAVQHTPGPDDPGNGSRAYREGWSAQRNRADVNAGPYNPGTAEGTEWARGWHARHRWSARNAAIAKAEGSASCDRCGSEMKGRAGDFGFCGECNAEIDDHDD